MSVALGERKEELRAEKLTLAVLLSGVAALALSDFVSPVYWALVALVAGLRFWRGPAFALTEMQASMIGWFGFVWVGLELLFGRAWAVAFTDFMLILALAVAIEAATPRNHLHRLLTATFLILAAAVLTDSFLFVLPLAAWLWFMWRASACLYAQGLREVAEVPPVRSDAWLMLAMIVGTALLFIAMPRFENHSALTGVQPRMKTGGFSDQVELGTFARSLDARVAFRVESEGLDPKLFRKRMIGRYWRGIALSRYDGHGWTRLPAVDRHAWGRRGTLRMDAREDKEDFHILVYREASDHPYVFLPDGWREVQKLPFRGVLNMRGDARFLSPPSRRVLLRMRLARRAHMPATWLPPVPAERDRRHTPPQVRHLLRSLLGAQPPATLASLLRLQQHLRSWRYDLQAPIDDRHPIASFVRLRRGHCELFATLMALAARELGFPARVVNGYYGGEWNESGQFLIVRQQEAHSWTEVWLDGRWIRLDATPPARWQLSGVRFPRLDDIWESVRLHWYRYVLAFQNEDRMRAYLQLWEWFRTSLPRLLLIGALAWGVYGFWRRWRARRPAHRLHAHWRIMDRWLARRGIRRRPWQPLCRVDPPPGLPVEAWREWVDAWERQCYRDERGWSAWQLRWRLRRLNKRCEGGVR